MMEDAFLDYRIPYCWRFYRTSPVNPSLQFVAGQMQHTSMSNKNLLKTFVNKLSQSENHIIFLNFMEKNPQIG